MGSLLGHDFSKVRLHTEEAAADSVSQPGAGAHAVGGQAGGANWHPHRATSTDGSPTLAGAPELAAGVPPQVHRVLASPGRVLPPPVRADMEDRFRTVAGAGLSGIPASGASTVSSPFDTGEREADEVARQVTGPSGRPPAGHAAANHDFADVRVHADGDAGDAAQAVGASAFTVGSHVVFAPGAYAPTTATGRTLLAHELAHVLQQRTMPGSGRRPVARQVADADRVKKLKKDYDDAVKTADWNLAAELLNGFSRDDILLRLAKRTVAEIADMHNKSVANPRVGPGSQIAQLTPPLLTDFAAKFRGASDLIRRSPEALKLIHEAEAAGVKFGGHAENGPAKNAWAYTVGDTVYVPKAHTDKIVSMSDFLFELNNAIRKPQFAGIEAAATAGTIAAKTYAYQTVEQEVEGMLRLGQVWFETKKALGGGKGLTAYDQEFYLEEYRAFQNRKKTKDQIIKDVLKRKYTAGSNKGKTTEQYYMEQYKTLHP
jgi:hypothetical protein